jgi:hypothetical protein
MGVKKSVKKGVKWGVKKGVEKRVKKAWDRIVLTERRIDITFAKRSRSIL